MENEKRKQWDPAREAGDDDEYVDAYVWADWTGKVYAGQVLRDYRWNGWAIPRFSRAVAEEVVRDQAALFQAGGFDTVHEFLAWAGDRIAVIEPAEWGVPDSDPHVAYHLEADDDGYYDIGGQNWCWDTMTADEVAGYAAWIDYREGPFGFGGSWITDPTLDETARHPVDAMYYRMPNPETYITPEEACAHGCITVTCTSCGDVLAGGTGGAA